MALKDTFFGTPARTTLTLGGTAALIALLLKRDAAKEAIVTATKKAEQATAKAFMPAGTEYLADLAFELAPKKGVSPWIILGITFAESTFGKGLTPPGPAGTGDFGARSASRCVAVNAAGACTKTLGTLVKELGFPVREEGGKLIPTTRGWGHGLYQLDLGSHYAFISTGKWSDPRAAMEYMINLYATDRDYLKKRFPNLGPVDLLRATIASYNAGRGAVAIALKKGVPPSMLDKGTAKVTYAEGYVDKILSKAVEFEPKT